jgi:signal peptidase II
MARSGGAAIGKWLGIAALVVALDQATKFAVERVFSYGERLAVVPGLFDLTLVYNRGAAFSFLANAAGWQRWFFIALGAAAAAFIVWLLARHGSQRLFAFALALILGGAIGNVIDRIARGHVVDFVLLHWQRFHWPAFNVADSAITLGAVLLVVDELRRVRRHR